MYINPPKPGLSTAETFLYMLRHDMQYTAEEARMLDIMLMLHAEHGGGNNSTFTTRVLTSSGTDAYSAYAGGICSLKGPRHGGANIKVVDQRRDLMEQVQDTDDEGQVADYLRRVLKKEAFDGSGLVYGMGHAVYTLSDPARGSSARSTRASLPGVQNMNGSSSSSKPSSVLPPSYSGSFGVRARRFAPTSTCIPVSFT